MVMAYLLLRTFGPRYLISRPACASSWTASAAPPRRRAPVLLLRQRVGHRASQVTAALRPDHDAAEVALEERRHVPVRVHVVAVVGEEGAVAPVDPAAVDEQGLVAVRQPVPLDRVPVEVELGTRSAIRSIRSRRSRSRSLRSVKSLILL